MHMQVPFIWMMLAVLVLRAIFTTANIGGQPPFSATMNKMLPCVALVSACMQSLAVETISV